MFSTVQSRLPLLLFAAGLLAAGTALVPSSALGQVAYEQKVTEGTGGFTGTLENEDAFGRSVAYLGDILGDSRPEMAVGAYTADASGTSDVGAVWIVSLNSDGTVEHQVKITDGSGGFPTGGLDAEDQFGVSVTDLGTMNGHPTLAVGARYDDDGGTDRGAVWILFLAQDGTVDSHQKISSTAGNGPGTLADGDQFGQEVANIGDLDGNGRDELAVGATGTDEHRGRVWTLFLNSDGTVSSTGKVDDSSPGISLDAIDDFGFSIALVGNLSGDGNRNLAVGAFRDDDGAENAGALWIVSLADDGTADGAQKISETSGGFSGSLASKDRFGSSAAGLGDLDGDGVPDLAVGAYLDDDGGPDRGALWILYLNSDGTVADHRKISDTNGGFGGSLANEDQFGISVASIGDLNNDTNRDLVVGAFGDDEATTNAGAFWMLFGEESLLPVELASFEATQAESNAVELRWTTASEQNNAGFQIQHRAPSAKAWRDRSFVESLPEAGTSAETHQYQHRVGNLESGTHHFRLKQVDLDGTAHRHDPVAVQIRMEDAISLGAPVPNPARSQATLSIAVKEQVKTTLTLYNVLGQKVRTVYRGTPAAGEARVARLETSSLPSGTYVLRLQANGMVKTQKLTVVQ